MAQEEHKAGATGQGKGDAALDMAVLYAEVVSAIKEVYDPEIPVNVYDLGLIYKLDISPSCAVSILMTFTAPNCPMADQVIDEIRRSVLSVPDVETCDIELTFEPPWDKRMLSEEARITLGMEPDEDTYGSLNEDESPFGKEAADRRTAGNESLGEALGNASDRVRSEGNGENVPPTRGL